MASFAVSLLGFAAIARCAPAPQVTLTPASGPIPSVISSEVTGATSHGPFSGTPTTTGALSRPPLASAIQPGPPAPVTYTNTNGDLQATFMPVPFQPAGGMGTNGTEPYYRKSMLTDLFFLALIDLQIP